MYTTLLYPSVPLGLAIFPVVHNVKFSDLKSDEQQKLLKGKVIADEMKSRRLLSDAELRDKKFWFNRGL